MRVALSLALLGGCRGASSPTVDGAAAIDGAPCAGRSLRFYGNGVGDIDRVKIRIDDPSTQVPGPPADVGATNFTIEFWVRGTLADNPTTAVTCGDNLAWINGNIVVDRDRFGQDRKFGISFAAGNVVFGVSGDGTGDKTICSSTKVLDDGWHHVAVQRRRSDGRMTLYVDGRLERDEAGPGGDISYPDDGVPGNFCGGPCTNSDPFLVLGAEKHDAGSAYPPFAGYFDELRISTANRYTSDFDPGETAFATDALTAALYHFDEADGDAIVDAVGTSPGVRRFGGTPPGPVWIDSSPVCH